MREADRGSVASPSVQGQAGALVARSTGCLRLPQASSTTQSTA